MTQSSHKIQIIVAAVSQLENELIALFKNLAHQKLKSKKKFCVALSGGQTPVNFYKKLSKIKNKRFWQGIHIFWADERFVDWEHPDSNYHLIKDKLLSKIPIPSKNIHPVKTDGYSVGAAAERYAQELQAIFKLNPYKFPVFDFILLGVGEDGHTASIFPGMKPDETKKPLTLGVKKLNVKYERVSLSLATLNAARNIVFLVTGFNKAAIVKRILEEKADLLPASWIKPKKGNVFFFLDKAASHEMDFKKIEPKLTSHYNKGVRITVHFKKGRAK